MKTRRNGAGHEGTALQITVVNGDLTFVRKPLLLGHYRSLKLTGTEHVMDRLVGGVMGDALKLALYPDAPRMNRVFLNTNVDPATFWQLPRPEAVIVVGLGDEGKLCAEDLVATVRQGVLAWAQRSAEREGDHSQPSEIAATLIGSGGTGISPDQSAQLIAQGVAEARKRLEEFNRKSGHGRRWPSVGTLHLIELYLDRATDAWRALRLQAAATPGQYDVADAVQPGAGALRRSLDSSYRGADYDLISALNQPNASGESSIAYTLDTKRARTEVRAQALQQRLVRNIVTTASNNAEALAGVGHALFNMLVPVEVRPFLSGKTEMLLELDQSTAGIPWELLETDDGDDTSAEPWAIRAKLLRKLRVKEPPSRRPDANADMSVLVIGEPACDRTRYPELPGARAEALAVYNLLNKRLSGSVEALIAPDDSTKPGPDALTVVTKLLEHGWRIVHISGHGAGPLMIGPEQIEPNDPPQTCGDPRGVVLSDDTFLGSREIQTMPVVPELVFVNCCHLARSSATVLDTLGDRAKFASGVAADLIRIGVRCVIAAGWAVDDDAASTFATTFYDSLLSGERFIDAVANARRAARACGGTTWAAYQCYGDPDWTFHTEVVDAQRPPAPTADKYDGIGSAVALQLALETIAITSSMQSWLRRRGDVNEHVSELEHLEARFADRWGSQGAIAEGFGSAWAEVGDLKRAREWYQRAVTAIDGGASIKAIEQLANLRARVAWDTVDAARRERIATRKQHARAAGSGKAGNGRARASAHAAPKASSAELTKAIAEARGEVEEAIALLDKLVSLRPTMERESLYGSAYKRLAMIESIAGDMNDGARTAIREMKRHYSQATVLGREGQLLDFSYPALNELAADIVLNAGTRGWKGLAGDLVEATGNCLKAKAETDPDFWSVLGQTELRVYQALARGSLASERADIEHAYADIQQRVSAARKWDSVVDTASFVLPQYASRASGSEKEAATALLSYLERLTDQTLAAAQPASRS